MSKKNVQTLKCIFIFNYNLSQAALKPLERSCLICRCIFRAFLVKICTCGIYTYNAVMVGQSLCHVSFLLLVSHETFSMHKDLHTETFLSSTIFIRLKRKRALIHPSPTCERTFKSFSLLVKQIEVKVFVFKVFSFQQIVKSTCLYCIRKNSLKLNSK